jgi:hypothetical protein
MNMRGHDHELDSLRAFRASAAHHDDDRDQALENEIRARISVLRDTPAVAPRRRMRWVLRQVPVAVVSALIVAFLINLQGTQGTSRPAVSAATAAPILNKSAQNVMQTVSGRGGANLIPAVQANPVTNAPDQGWIYYNQETGEVAMSPASSPDTMQVPTVAPERMINGPAALEHHELDNVPVHTNTLLRALRQGASEAALDRDLDYLPFRTAAAYVSNSMVPPAARAAFLRALARLDGVDVAGSGADVLGRSGIVISRLDAVSGIRQAYIFNTSTGRVLQQSETLTTGPSFGTCQMGTVLMIELYDEYGSPIKPDAAPWGRWPEVHDTCTPS